MTQRKFTFLFVGLMLLFLLSSCTLKDTKNVEAQNVSQKKYADEGPQIEKSLPLFNGEVSRLKKDDTQALKISEEKWLETKQAFLKEHKTFSIDDLKNLAISDFNITEAWAGTLDGRKFELGLYRNDNFFILSSKYDGQERFYLLLEFFESPWVYYGQSVRFQQIAKGVGVSYNIVTGIFEDSYPDQFFDNIVHDLSALKEKRKLSIGDEIKVAGNNAKMIYEYALVIIPDEKTDNALGGKIVEEFSSIADFNHDGVKETAKVVAFDDGQYFALQICNSEGNILWKTEAAKAHAGWLSLFLCRSDRADYLLRYSPYMSQGMCDYQYDLFFLDSSGNEVIVDSDSVEFDINFGSPGHLAFNPDEIAAFMNKVNAYLENSMVLLNTDVNLKFEDESHLEDTLWWLDNEEGFIYDKTANLNYILAAYKKYRESK